MKRFLSLILTVALLLSFLPTGWVNITASAATSDFAGGDGTESSPYLISSAGQLSNVRYYLDAHFKLTCHIRSGTSNWWPIGDTESEAFTGTFDGNGFCIDNLEMHSSAENNDIAGLFGYNEGVIKNLCVSGSTVSASSSSINISYISSSSYAGGIAGYNKGTITNCYNTVTIEASASGCGPMSYAGGIAGNNYGTITNCYNTGTVFASARNQASVTDNAWAEAGGIVGYNRGTIKNCYNIGAVSASVSAVSPKAWAGGIAGSNASTITNCYYIDNMPNGGGSGKKCTAEQLGQQSTYVGFDFENVWELDTSIQPYPILKTTHYHIYENVCDSICDICGHSRIPPHSYEWKIDNENNCAVDGVKHEECTICHIRRSENTVIEATGNHTFTDEKDTQCDVCEGVFYQILFNGNGGTSIERIITSPGSSITLSSKPTRYGYIFVGWATTQNGNVIYQPYATYCADAPVTLYAQWNKGCASCDGIGSFTCSSCDGKGTLSCKTCSGSGKVSVNCGTCFGTGNESYECGVCDGVGKVNSPINCSKCNGSGWTCNDCGRGVSLLGKCSCGSSSKYYCSKCGGSSASNWIPCSYCSGTGTRTKTCGACSGQKYKTCTNCYGYGTLDHSTCGGTGRVTCTRCNGTGELIRTDVEAPSAPILKKLTANSVTLNTIANGEYSIDGVTWQDSPIFENLEAGQEYTFYQRYAKTDTTNASKASSALTIKLVPYTIVFKDWDGTVLSTKTYHYGDKVTAPSTPTRTDDKTYTYTFAGWDKAVVDCTGNATYTATYTATYKSTYINYTVVFKNWDGTVLSTKTYRNGDKVTAPSNPTRPADNANAYTFVGWDKEIVACENDAVYTAVYEVDHAHVYESIRCGLCGYVCSHTICTTSYRYYHICTSCRNYGICGSDLTFTSDSDGTLIISGTGMMSNYREVDTLMPYDYCRTPAENVIIEQGVTSIAEYAYEDYAKLQSIAIPNSVTSIGQTAFSGCDSLTKVVYCGTQEQWDAVRIGRYNERLEKATLQLHEYEDGVCVYCEHIAEYKVTFKNWDDTLLSTEVYHYGDRVTVPGNPTRPADNTYTYSFLGWDKTVVNCVGNATYTATYTKEYIDYTVEFKDWNGDVLSTKTYHYGDKVTAPKNPVRAADKTYTYAFAGWDSDVVDCAGNATYTATYTASYIDYTVVFKDWNGNVITSETYHWGNTVTVPTDPTRDADEEYKYTFIGWGTEIVPCAGDATYTACYMAIKKLNGWVSEGGKWYYYIDDVPQTNWELVSGKWYYFDDSGIMKTGWLKSGNIWYYLQPSGAMATGWAQNNGKWYYFDGSGAMQTGWLQSASTWYYLQSSGAMATGWQKIGAIWYYFQSGGAMQTGWVQVSGKWYYFNSSGAMQIGWLKLDNTWYYFHSSGAMATGSVKIGTKTYNFSGSGACLNP